MTFEIYTLLKNSKTLFFQFRGKNRRCENPKICLKIDKKKKLQKVIIVVVSITFLRKY
jgi:hypothetical protein